MKTKKIALKRFKVTKNGKILRGKQMARHLRSNKSKKQIRRFNAAAQVSKTMERMVSRLLPYS